MWKRQKEETDIRKTRVMSWVNTHPECFQTTPLGSGCLCSSFMERKLGIREGKELVQGCTAGSGGVAIGLSIPGSKARTRPHISWQVDIRHLRSADGTHLFFLLPGLLQSWRPLGTM
jgi:hypothetical protein